MRNGHKPNQQLFCFSIQFLASSCAVKMNMGISFNQNMAASRNNFEPLVRGSLLTLGKFDRVAKCLVGN
jgi:hypothetical protein